MAMQREDYPKAYDYWYELLNSQPSKVLFLNILAKLEAQIHQEFRQKILYLWVDKKPKTLSAWRSLAYEQICQSSYSAITPLKKYIQLAKEQSKRLNLLPLFDCSNNAFRLKISTQLIASKIVEPELVHLHSLNLKQSGRYQEALSTINNLSDKGTNQDIYLLEAELLLLIGKTKESEQHYVQLFNKNPDDYMGQYRLAEFYYQTGRYNDAKTFLTKLISTYPNDRNSQYLLAASHYMQQEYRLSKDLFLNLLRVKNLRQSSLYYLGEIALAEDQYQQALDYFEQVKDQSFYLDAQLKKWRIIGKDNIDSAIEGLFTMASRFPEQRLAIKLTQIELMEQADLKLEALQELVSLADDLPQHIKLQQLRMKWLVDLEYYHHIDANLQASLENLDESTLKIVLVESTIFYLIIQDLPEIAIRSISNQKFLMPDSLTYRYLLGLSYSIAGKHDQALTLISEIQKNHPNNLEFMNALAYCYILANRELESAETLLFTALNTDPNNAAYLDSLGWLYYMQDNLDKSEEFLLKADALSQSPSIKVHLIELYMKQGNESKAIQLLIQATGLFPKNKVLSNLLKKYQHTI